MKLIVVYESLWGNTAAIAEAIAEGIGPEVQSLSTAQASASAIAEADLLVVGAPLIAFRLPSDVILKSIEANRNMEKIAPDLSQPAMSTWLAVLPKGSGRSAAFETRLWWSPGNATTAIERAMEKAGYPPIAKAKRFIVKGRYGPLRAGELEKAKLWGVELKQKLIA